MLQEQSEFPVVFCINCHGRDMDTFIPERFQPEHFPGQAGMTKEDYVIIF